MIPIPKEENLKQFHTSRFLSFMEIRTALQLWSLSEIAWTPFLTVLGHLSDRGDPKGDTVTRNRA